MKFIFDKCERQQQSSNREEKKKKKAKAKVEEKRKYAKRLRGIVSLKNQ